MRRPANESSAPSRVKRGRAVLVGYGLDDDGGHVRYTRGDSVELYGGSDSAHCEMQRRARQIQEEIAKMGISLDRMTYEQFEIIQGIVERVNAE